jgi:hemerythrin superfamily protein
MTLEDQDVVSVVQRDHREIEQMMARVESSIDGERQDAFEELVRKLAIHETAEEEGVHPLLRDSATDVVDPILSEEDAAKRRLSDLEGVNVSSGAFMEQFKLLKSDVLAHAQHEEQQEHPRLRAEESPEKLEQLGKMFETAERMAPTRPHASAPESRAGNLALGPVLAVADRVRDAIRDARNDR